MQPLSPSAAIRTATSPLLPNLLAPPTSPQMTMVFDLETTGLIQAFNPTVRSDVGISQFALREYGKKNNLVRFTDILEQPLRAVDVGKLTTATYAETLEAMSPGGVRWQSGFKNPTNVLYGVHSRHVDATRAAIAGRGDILAKESDLVRTMTGYLEAGHKIKGWNIGFDMLVMGQAAARANPALHQQWIKAFNFASQQGRIEDMASGANKFMFLSAQESFMQGKSGGREFFTLGQVDKDIRALVKTGKLSAEEIDKLTYDKMIETHKGFKEFFAQRSKGAGVSYESYHKWLEISKSRHGLFESPQDWFSVQSFRAGQSTPDVRYTKGWSADILLSALAPKGLKGSTLEKKALELIDEGKVLTSHEGLADTAYEEILDDIFNIKARNFKGAWAEVSLKMKKYGISQTQQEFFHNWQSAIEGKSKSQLKEVAQAATRHLDTSWTTTLSEKIGIAAATARPVAEAARSRPETLKQIYGRAFQEVSGGARGFTKAHPYITGLGALLGGIMIGDALLPRKQDRIEGVRNPESLNLNIHGIYFGGPGRGVARALTDFGSGRLFGNPVSAGFNELQAYRASTFIKYPDKSGTPFTDLEKAYQTWDTARNTGESNIRELTRRDYKIMKASRAKVGGLNQSAWVGVMDLKHYRIKVDDADTLTLETKSIFSKRRRVSVRLAGIDAPEIEHPIGDPGSYSRFQEDQFAGKASAEYLQHLIERQQSLRLVVDPKSRTYNRNLAVLVGDRGANLNLQLVKSGAAASLPWSKAGIVDQNMFNEAEAMAARGGVGMWQSKGWQMHRAMGLIAGERVTNTTLASLDRLSKSAALSRWYGLVQDAHRNRGTPYTRQEMQGMYQAGLSHRVEVQRRLNRRTKEDGFVPGIRGPNSPWGIVGHGINPSRQDYGNVSDFSSGAPQGSRFQSASLARYLEKAGMAPAEFRHGMAGFLSSSQNRLCMRIMQLAGRIQMPSGLSETMSPASLFSIESKGAKGKVGLPVYDPIRQSVEHGLKTGLPGYQLRPTEADWAFHQDVRRLINMGRKLPVSGQDDLLLELISEGRNPAGNAAGLVDMAKSGLESIKNRPPVVHTPPSIPTATNLAVQPGQSANARALTSSPLAAAPDTKAIPLQTVVEGKQLADVAVEQKVKREALRRPAPEPKPIAETVPPYIPKEPQPAPPTTSSVKARGVKQATRDAGVSAGRAESVVKAGIKRTSSTHLVVGGGIALGLMAAAGAAVGISLASRRRDQEISSRMANGPVYRHPNEFMGMKPFGDFVSSYEQGAWEGMQEEGSNRAEALAGMQMMVILGQMAFGIQRQDPLLQIWDHFYEGKGGIAGKRNIGAFTRRVRGKLKDMGFSQREIDVWADQVKSKKGFVNKINKDLSDKSFVDKVGEKWSAIKSYPNKIVEWMSGKKSALNKNFVQSAKDWITNLTVKPMAAKYGLTAEQFLNAGKTNKLDAIKKMHKIHAGSRFGHDVDAAKYLYTHLIKDVKGFTAKMTGAGRILNNLGNLKQMMAAHLGGTPEIAKQVVKMENIFTKVGSRLEAFGTKNQIFASKFDKTTKTLGGLGSKLNKFGVSKIGRVAGKLPYASIAFGILDGLTTMDQYENATKGFVVEAAAGTTRGIVEMAGMGAIIPAAKAGFALGGLIGEAIFPAGGGVPGAIIGAAVGAVAALAVIVGTLVLGQVAAGGVRMAGKTVLGARMRRNPSPTDYITPQQLFPATGFDALRENGLGPLQQFHAIDSPREDLTPFGGAYNPIRGQDIHARTLQIVENKRNVVGRPDAPRPISQFTPTFGLVNNVLWNSRRGSKVRSVVERYSHSGRQPRMDRNRSRMLARAA